MDGWLNQMNIYFIDLFQKTILLQYLMHTKQEKSKKNKKKRNSYTQI